MAYLDKISVGGTEYDIQDSKAARQTEVDELKNAVEQLEPGLSDDAKAALLNCFQHMAWIDEHGQDYYDALEVALYADSYPRITAVFDAGANVIYTDDALDSLKQYLTVKYFETYESEGETISSTNYSLSGTLIEGSSIVVVHYNELVTTFTVDGIVDFYNRYIINFPSSNKIIRINGESFDASVGNGYIKPNQNRSMLCSEKGKVAFSSTPTDYVPTNYFGIPFPDGATKATIEFTPNTLYAYLSEYHTVDGSVAHLRRTHDSMGWKQSGYTFDVGEHLDGMVLGVNFKENSAGSTPVTSIDSVKIVFE